MVKNELDIFGLVHLDGVWCCAWCQVVELSLAWVGYCRRRGIRTWQGEVEALYTLEFGRGPLAVARRSGAAKVSEYSRPVSEKRTESCRVGSAPCF
jgi:hypothetical protein